MSKAISAAVAAVVSTESNVPSTLCGRSWVDVEASIKDIGFKTQRVEASMSDLTADRDVLDANLLGWVVQTFADGKFVKFADNHEKSPGKLMPIPYAEFTKVREIYVGAAFDAGSATLDAAAKVWERAIGRLLPLGFVWPVAENKDAVRIAAKRAAEVAKYEKKSDGALLEEKAALVAKGDVKSLKAAQAVAKELERREKPALEAVVKDCAALRDKLIARAKELAKLGTADSVELLTAALNALSE
jgi:hypothetical protein